MFEIASFKKVLCYFAITSNRTLFCFAFPNTVVHFFFEETPKDEEKRRIRGLFPKEILSCDSYDHDLVVRWILYIQLSSDKRLSFYQRLRVCFIFSLFLEKSTVYPRLYMAQPGVTMGPQNDDSFSLGIKNLRRVINSSIM